MKRVLKVLSAALVLCLTVVPVSAFAGAAAEGTEYVITGPYENVDFSSWKGYKTQLHCHTTASDGFLTVKELVQKSYDLGYDAVAITDHGTLNKGWNNEPDLVPLIRLVKYERTQMADIIPFTDDEYKAILNGTAATTNGTKRSNGMIDVPLGIELNMATPVADCHLTGYFSTYGQGLAGVYGDYETPSEGVRACGGISMLAHVGEYVYTDKDSADHVGQLVDEYYVDKFAKLFMNNVGSSVGMGINSATDAHTRCDRILYDQILQKTIPNGVVPWGFTFSDSHNDTSVNDAYTIHYMPTLSNDELRKSMETGTFFSVSHYSNGVELNGMPEMPGYDESKVDWKADTPLVTNVKVNETTDSISVEGVRFDTITWISDGKVLKRGGLEATTLDLDDFSEDEIGCYVRFYITGPDGICYSQPMVVEREGVDFVPVEVPDTVDLPYALRQFSNIMDKLFLSNSIIVRIFKYFALGY